MNCSKKNTFASENLNKYQMRNVFFLCLFFWASALFSHTIWVETASVGKMNKKHEVKVFFGEMGEPTFTSRWFSDLKELQLVLTTPSGKQEILEKQAQEAYFQAYFTPTEKGIYTIHTKHLVKDVFREMKITYQTTAFVNVGAEEKTLKLGDAPTQIQVNTKPIKKDETAILTFFKEEELAQKQAVTITSENGWGKNYRTNVRGEISFKPLWKGKYLVQFSLPKKEAGTHNDTNYTTDYQSITYLIEVK